MSPPASGSLARLTRLVLASVALTVGAPSARAQAPADDPDRRAFERGLQCFDGEQYFCAVESWEALIERVGAPRAWKVLYNLGVAHDALGDATRALDRWESFLEVAPAGEAEGQRADAARRIAGLRARFGEIDVRSADGVAALARVGAGKERPAGFRVLVAPGRHEVVITAPGRPIQRVTVDIAAGVRREVQVASELPAAPQPRPSPPREQQIPASDAGVDLPTGLAIGFGAATVVSFALPLGLGLRAGSLRDDAIAAPTRASYDAATSDYEGARTAYSVSYVLPAALGAATVGFLLWALAEGDADAPTAALPHVRF